MHVIRQIPTHVWLIFCFVVLLIAYYVRPDPVTVDLVKGFAGALLLSLRSGQSPDNTPSRLAPPLRDQP